MKDHPKVKEGYTHACTHVSSGHFFKLVKIKDIVSDAFDELLANDKGRREPAK